jgi:hypothetical protein
MPNAFYDWLNKHKDDRQLELAIVRGQMFRDGYGLAMAGLGASSI